MSSASVKGSWETSTGSRGEFVRKESQFRNWITASGGEFPAEAGRYVIYVSYACPWAHRTLLYRAKKGLQDVIDISVVHWFLDGKSGWAFDGTDADTGFHHLRQLYTQSNPDYSGNVTVPALYDKKRGVIVNNESSEIIRMLNSEFNAFCKTEEQRALDFYPEPLRRAIDEVNSWVYPMFNNGVYRSGFAKSQEAYETACREVFEALDRMEDILSRQRYLCGDRLTEADIRAFTTLLRFDPVYVTHFKCNKKRLVDYPNVWNYTKDLYQSPGVAETCEMFHIKHHYYESHKSINPTGIVPLGFDVDFSEPHDRDRFARERE